MPNIGREQPTLLITNDIERTTKELFARYAERMSIENELDAYISGFHLDALSSGLPLNVDLDTTLTVIAVNLYRLLARHSPATNTPPPTASRVTASTAPAPSTSTTTRSRSNHASAPTTPCSSTPDSPTKPPPSPGSTTANSSSGSRPAKTAGRLSYRESRLIANSCAGRGRRPAVR